MYPRFFFRLPRAGRPHVYLGELWALVLAALTLLALGGLTSYIFFLIESKKLIVIEWFCGPRSAWRYAIHSTFAPRIAPQNSPDTQECTFERSMNSKRLQRVLRTSR